MENIITSIKAQKRNSNRVNLYIDDEYAFSCSLEIIYKNNLKKGQAVNKEMLSKIVFEDNYLKCKSYAFKSLERNSKTEKQMYNKLLDKGYDDEVIEKVILLLKDYNLINDDRYVEMYIKEKINNQGRYKIKYSLINKGISQELIDEKLEYIDNEVEFNVALKLAEKRYNILSKSEKDSMKLYKKTGQYLIRRGYSYDLVKEVLGKVVPNEI